MFRGEEMACQLTAPVALAENPVLIPSMKMLAHNAQ